MPRRNRIPLEHRERIIRAFDDEEEDYLLVADTLGVNRSTARGIVARYIREGRIRERPRGGRNNVRVDDEMRDCLEEIISENCLLTLTKINHELRGRLPVKPEIHERTVSRTLDGMLFRVKLARPLPADRNRPDVLNKGVDYATWLMNYAVVRHCVFVDECGFLNIVEQAISCLKAAIKADISRPEIQRRMDDRDEARVRGIPLGEFRTQQLHEALHRNIDTITAAKSAQWYRFMQTYLPKCLNREVIEG